MEDKIIKVERKDGIIYEKRVPKKKYNQSLHIKVNENFREMLEVISNKKGLSHSAIVRVALEEYCEKNA